MIYETLLVEKQEGVGIITLNRPERLNALSLTLQMELDQAITQFEDDDEVKAIIVTGAGDKAFSAGADLRDRVERREKGIHEPKRPQWFGVECWKPKIAAINGYALAGGFTLAMDCDIRIAAENAQLGITETRWNMPAFWVSPLARHVTLGHALEIALWGDGRITAQRAYEMGFINRVVPQDRLMEDAMSWAERMLYLAPRTVRNLKEIIYRGCVLTPEEGIVFGNALEQNLVGMEDSVEGPKAFVENRKPIFKNR